MGSSPGRLVAALGAAGLLLLPACGDDGGGNDIAAPSFDVNAVCTLAEEIFAQDSVPTAAQLTRYQELAPEELRGQVDTVGEAFGRVDHVALLALLAQDHVEAALEAIHAFEEENCGIPHSEETEVPRGVTQDIEADAARVDVTAVDYGFEFAPPLEAGRTSFVVTNTGAEAHFLYLVRLAPGASLEQLLGEPRPPGLTTFEASSKLAAPGGTDEEAVSLQLDAGEYAMLCLLADADGTPHALLGMAVPFAVA